MKKKIPSWFQIKITFSSMTKTIPRAVHLITKYAPLWTLASIILVIILGLLPLGTLYIMNQIVDTVTAGINLTDKNTVIQELTLLLFAAALLSLTSACGKILSSYVTQAQTLIITDKISDIIHEKSLKLDLAYYENSAYQNTLQQAQITGILKPGKVVSDIIQMGQNFISIFAVGSLILSFSPIAGIVLVCAALPAASLKILYSKKTYDLSLKQTEMDRTAFYYHRILTTASYAKEIKIFSSGSFFRRRYNTLRHSIRHVKLTLSRSEAIWETITQIFITIAIFGSFAVIAFMTIGGEITLGNMVVYFSGFQMCIGYVQSIFESMDALYEDNLFLTNLFEFFDLEPTVPVPKNPVPAPEIISEGIILSGVCFKYPGTEKQVLSDINLSLPKGSVTAFVGENGAGKSSLIKLICRLYLQDSGTITVDGINLDEISPDDWDRKLSVLFQDYLHYNMTAGENIWIADTSKEPDQLLMDKAVKLANAEGVIKNLHSGYETMLGRYFTKGEELSIGQWQKIALARIFYRDAEVIILDEPASSLDALAEAEIFKEFKEIIKGKTAILISHRFSTIKMADNIYVLKNGRIIEHGRHEELLLKKGYYYKMYHAQIDLYIDN